MIPPDLNFLQQRERNLRRAAVSVLSQVIFYAKILFLIARLLPNLAKTEDIAQNTAEILRYYNLNEIILDIGYNYVRRHKIKTLLTFDRSRSKLKVRTTIMKIFTSYLFYFIYLVVSYYCVFHCSHCWNSSTVV